MSGFVEGSYAVGEAIRLVSSKYRLETSDKRFFDRLRLLGSKGISTLMYESKGDILREKGACGFQERFHSWAAVQAACINGSCPGSLGSSGG